MAKTKTAKVARRSAGKKPAKGARNAGRKAGPRRKAPVSKATPRPKRAAPAAAPALPDTGRPTALAIAKAALDKKAEDVTVLDVRGLTGYADYFVLMTADSDRQAS